MMCSAITLRAVFAAQINSTERKCGARGATLAIELVDAIVPFWSKLADSPARYARRPAPLVLLPIREIDSPGFSASIRVELTKAFLLGKAAKS